MECVISYACMERKTDADPHLNMNGTVGMYHQNWSDQNMYGTLSWHNAETMVVSDKNLKVGGGEPSVFRCVDSVYSDKDI